MSVFERSTAGGQRPGAKPNPIDRFSVGSYLADGTKLLRIQHRIEAAADGALIELEDCKTLELVIWSERELADRGLRSVRPEASGTVAAKPW